MEKLHFYLSNGLWKIAEKCFDPNSKLQNEFLWSVAVHPNVHSFGSHIIATPWQQCWMALNILEGDNDGRVVPKKDEIDLLRKEIDFQYTLRKHWSDPFVQQLFSLYSKIQTHVPVSFSESETKNFNSNLMNLLTLLLKESPSTAHSFLTQLLQHGIFAGTCESILNEMDKSNEHLCNLIVSTLCKTDSVSPHSSQIVSVLQTSLKSNLCLLLLANDKIDIIHSMIEEHKKLFRSNSAMRLQNLLDNGIEPLSCFSDMVIMERHFLLQIIDLLNSHLDEFPLLSKSKNIPPFIWPLILLYNWDNPKLSDSILLQLIEKCKEATKDKTITQITYILEWYISFCRWCEKHEISENKEDKLSKQNLLKKAKEHSVLYLINNTTDLSVTDWSQIRALLQHGKSSDTEDKKSWDLVLFDGYCCMIMVFQAIISADEIYRMAQAQKVNLEDIHSLNGAFASLYNDTVTQNLKKVKAMLQSLYPVAFRLEILENIFASIFTTYEDMKKFNYFLNCSFNLDKYLEKVQAKNKFSFSEKPSRRNLTSTAGNVPASQVYEEEEANKKLKLRGFMCKKYIVRDLIYLVKECLEKLEEDSGAQNQSVSVDVPCSIKPSQMENRLDRLLESVSEATWRLQLVTDPEFISQIGTMQFACGKNSNHHFDGEWIYLQQELDRCGFLKTRKKSNEKADEIGSHRSSSTGNENLTSSELQMYSMQSRSVNGPAIMNQMLSCDSSLVVQCLSRGDVLNADHIIQMMSTEENRQNLEGELNFTRGINDLKKKLHNLSAESPRKSGMDSVSKARSLQAIQIIANQGVNSTALTNQVERFLSAHTLPSIQSHSKVSAGSVLQCIENSTAMITIDLALTTANTFQDFKDLLNIASKYCPELNTRVQSPISAQATSTKPLGYIVYTQNLMMLLQEINRNRPSDTDAEISLHQFLRSHQYPFSLKSLKDNINFWKLLNLAFLDFDKNVEESRYLVGSKEGLLVKCQKNIKETQNIFESVIKLTESSSEFMDLGKPDVPAGEISKNVNYCDLLSRYLSDLSTFVLENVSTKGGVLSEPITLHTLLEQSAVDIVDKLIFDHHIEPGVLEKKAQQLGFNLLASLIAGCCPKLPQMMSANENSACPLADRIVLNELFPDYKSLSPSDPIKVVTNILSELLIAFQTYSENKQCDEMEEECGKDLLTLNDISELRSDMKIQRILEKTLDLNFVEVKTLNEFESLTFFTCLLNLMMCHCYLCSKLDTTDSIYSNHLFFRDIGFYFLGYNVGELGFVSILDVRQLVLGDVFVYGFTSKFLENPNCLRFSPDPRLLFATINNFTISSPPLFILNFENYETELEEAIAKYVQASVTVEEEKVFVNDLVVNYLDKILVPQCIDSKDSDQNRNNVLLKFLLDYSSDELNDELARLTNSVSDILVKVRPKCREIMFRLSYDVTYSNAAKQVEEEFVEKWLSRSLTEPILRHFSQNSRILADIVQKIHEAKEPVPTEVARDVLTEEKLKYLDHLFGAPWLQHLSALFHGNTVIAALSKYPKDENLVKFFEECVASSNWSQCVDVLFALPDYFVFSNLTVKRFKDIALREATIAASKKVSDQHKSWYFSEHISDVNIRTATVMSCCKHWPGSVACAQLTSIVYDNPLLPVETREMLMCLIKKIKVYTAIQEFVSDLDARTWHDVCTIANDTPKVIIKCLLKNKKLELCLKWIGLPGVLNSIQPFIDSDFVLPFFENLSQEVELVNQLLDSLPGEKLCQIYNDVMFQLTSVSSISYLVQRALRVDQSPRYRLVEISLKFLFQLDPEDQSLLVHLISSPLLIIEQLIMNMKLDALETVLKIGRQITDEELLDQNEINKLIVSYAAKSVEFDFIKADKNYDMKASFISTTSHGNPDFMVPLEVPDKSQWVPDNMVSLCMCCRLVSFSMFNRRHHCRRCGRVVCGSCSTHRMKVAGYHGVVVRVCQNCYLYQMKADDDMNGSQSVDTFESFNLKQQDLNCWLLSTDSSRNATLREEFSYEYTPNVTLCLALYNFLPDGTHAGVLFEQSVKMLKLLQQNCKSGNSEVDFGVATEIIRSLILGAKVKYSHAGLISGMECCDELLSQVDIIQLLIDNYCTGLIPTEPLSGATLRCLRDKLVEEELWELAMEISTKCGLDRTGVWAAWGKVCLAAGSWEDARIKFSHCLKSSPKPARNPPLVNEICHILESATSFPNVKIQQKLPEKGQVVAQEIAQILSTLKHISQGKSLPLSAISAKNSVHYEEEIYYLATYGSHQALLSFYFKQDELKNALNYLLQMQLEPDLFYECLLLPSYRSDQHEKFKSSLLSVDSSLDSFKKYLSHSCTILQKIGYLNTLYDLQVLMKDYVRAAVTCIHLYQKSAANFTELVSRSSHLHTALRHLEEELGAIMKKTKRLDCIMQMDPKTINRHMNTIWRQLEAAKFLSACESQDKFTVKDIFPDEVTEECELPTLFDGNPQRIILVKMIVLLGKNIAEGFGVAFRIIQDHHLDLHAICIGLGKKLAENGRTSDIPALVDCLKTSGVADVNPLIDKTISVSIPILKQNEVPLTELEPLAKLIKNVELRVNAFIDTQQLVSAYILAVNSNRLNDIERIMQVAEQTGQESIKKICKSKLDQSIESGSARPSTK